MEVIVPRKRRNEPLAVATETAMTVLAGDLGVSFGMNPNQGRALTDVWNGAVDRLHG